MTGSAEQRTLGFLLGIALLFLAFTQAASVNALRPVTGQSGNPVTTVSAASFAPILAPDAIAAAFGTKLATRAEAATTQPLPTTLAGTTVRINGEFAPLFFVSPAQVNFLIPPGTPSGTAGIVITSGDGTTSSGTVQIAAVAPALFAANGNGQGALAALLLRVKANGQQSYQPLAQYSETEKSFVTRPLDFGEESDQLFLILYLTGLRQAATGGVRVSIGGVEYAPQFVGQVAGFAGLDQINVALPRSFGGRGRITLLVRANGNGASNAGEFEIGSGTQAPGTNAPLQITAPAQAVLAGEELEISGAGFAANPRENAVQIVADDGVAAKADVLAVSGSTIRIRVPFGAGTGQIKVSRAQIEASAAIRVRTSVSGFVERVVQQEGRQVRVPISGARVRVNGRPETERVTDAEGSFVLPDVPPSLKGEFEVLPPASGALNFPAKKLGLRVRAGRDNQLPRGDEQTVISGIQFPLLADSDSSSSEPNANANAASPDQNLTLTFLEPGRTPANLPPGHFSTRIAQIAPFGQTISPGVRLSFPNADAIPAGTAAKLFKFDQTNGSVTLGQFVEIGAATVTADGQRVETAANAVTEGSYYFVSVARPTAAINGRVVESDGRPVPRAVVQARGQSTFTDGFGGFVLRDVPVMSPNSVGGDRIRIEVSYQRPDGRVSRKDSNEIELAAGALVTVKPEIALDPVTSNLSPVILAPTNLSLQAGETRDFDFIANDPDSTQAVRLALSGTAAIFTTLSDQGRGAYRLRLAPVAAGSYTLNLSAADDTGRQSRETIAVVVNQPDNTRPAAEGQSVTTLEDTARRITLAGRDPGGRGLTYVVVDQPARGSLSGTPPNLTYMPSPNFNGVDSLIFKVGNGITESRLATVFIVVTPVNDAPVLNISGAATANAGETINLELTATDVDAGQVMTFTGTNLPPGATLIIESETRARFLWTPTFTQAGNYVARFKVTDNGAPPESRERNIAISVVAKWAQTTGLEGGIVHTILAKDDDLYAGTEGGGIFLSSNGGISWLAVNNGLGSPYVRSLASRGGDLFAGTQHGVYRSGDKGMSWVPAHNGIEFQEVLALAVSGVRLFAGTASIIGQPEKDGVYQSTDNGQTWSRVGNGLPNAVVRAFAVSNASLLAGTEGGFGIFRSNDNGASWAAANNGLRLSDGRTPRVIWSMAVTNAGIFAGTDLGVFRSTDLGNSWTATGNGLPLCHVFSLAANGGTLYAGTFGCGLYRSMNNGASWTLLYPALPNYFAISLAVRGAQLYVGTEGEGVFRSNNSGDTWRQLNSGLINQQAHSLVAGSEAIIAGSFTGVYRSTDAGATWEKGDAGLPALRLIYDVAGKGQNYLAGFADGQLYKSGDGGRSWARVYTFETGVLSLAMDGDKVYAGTFNGVYRSLDNGLTWRDISTGLTNRKVNAVVVNGADIVAGTDFGVFRLAADGQSWTVLNAGFICPCINKFAVSNGTIYAASSQGVYQLTGQRASWTTLGSGLIGLRFLSIFGRGQDVYAGSDQGDLYLYSPDTGWKLLNTDLPRTRTLSITAKGSDLLIGTGASIYRLTDQTQSWAPLNTGLTNRQTNSLIVAGNDAFVATLGSGVFHSTDQGQSWSPVNTGLPLNTNVRKIVTNGSSLWAATFGDGVHRSTDQGARWTPANSGLNNRFVNELFLSGATLYAGTDGGVFRSTDGGTGWSQINSGLTNLRVVSFTADAGVIYAGTDGGGVSRLNPDGASWTQVNRGLISQSVTALGVSGGALYAGTTGGGICISRDGGMNWTAVNNALPANLNVYAFAVSGRKIYAGSIYGVFVTENEGQSWTQINAGLLNTFVTGLAVSGDQLFASTASGGVFGSRIPQI